MKNVVLGHTFALNNLRDNGDTEEKAVVYLWAPSTERPYGHSAIKLITHNKEEYISFMPGEDSIPDPSCMALYWNFCLYWKMSSKLLTLNELEQYPNYQSFEILSLNMLHMMAYAKELKKESHASRSEPDFETGRETEAERKVLEQAQRLIKKKHYGLRCCYDDTDICSGVVFKMLEAGGIRQHIPYSVSFFDPRHLLLLLLRTPLAISVLSPAFYSLILLETHQAKESAMIPALGVFSQIAITLWLDKYVLPNRKIFGIPFSHHRTRQLVEVCGYDNVVQFCALLGIAFGGLYFRRSLTAIPENTRFVTPFGIDFFEWVFFSILGGALFGYAASLLYVTAGLRLYLTPKGLSRLLNYLDDTKSLTPALRHYFLLKESGLFIFVILAVSLSYSTRRYWVEPHTSFLMGVPLSVTSAYLCTKLYDLGITRLCKPKDEWERLNESEQKVLLSHEVHPAQFAFLSLLTSFGIFLAVLLTQKNLTNDVLVNSLISILGAGLGYFGGAISYELGTHLKNTISQHFFNPKNNEDIHKNSHPILSFPAIDEQNDFKNSSLSTSSEAKLELATPLLKVWFPVEPKK